VTQEFLHYFDVLSIRLKSVVGPPERVPRDSLLIPALIMLDGSA